MYMYAKCSFYSHYIVYYNFKQKLIEFYTLLLTVFIAITSISNFMIIS